MRYIHYHSFSLIQRALQSHTPADSDVAVEPERVLPVFGPVGRMERRDIKRRQAVVYVAFHIHLTL